jgi:hypothetical protein
MPTSTKTTVAKKSSRPRRKKKAPEALTEVPPHSRVRVRVRVMGLSQRPLDHRLKTVA